VPHGLHVVYSLPGYVSYCAFPILLSLLDVGEPGRDVMDRKRLPRKNARGGMDIGRQDLGQVVGNGWARDRGGL
jgi:hypothetical protein